MRNRAKCKLCKSIIESFAKGDLVSCSCGEIAIEGFDPHFTAYYNDINNFLRIDDEGNEIVVKEKDQEPSLKETIHNSLKEICNKIESLPDNLKYEPITQSEMGSILSLLLELLQP